MTQPNLPSTVQVFIAAAEHANQDPTWSNLG